MGFLSNFVEKRRLNLQHQELDNFLEVLSGMDDYEITPIIEGAIFITSKINSSYCVICEDPFFSLTINPHITEALNSLIRTAQANKKLTEAACLKVWLFTFRAAMRIELRKKTKDLWKELSRGMKKGEEFFPEGFAPKEFLSISLSQKYPQQYELLNDVLYEIIKKNSYRLAILIKGESDFYKDFINNIDEDIHNELTFEKFIKVSQNTIDNKEHTRSYVMKFLALELCSPSEIKNTPQMLTIYSFMKTDNLVDRLQYIGAYQHYGKEFGVPSHLVEQALKIRQIYPF